MDSAGTHAGRIPVIEIIVTEHLDLWAMPQLRARLDEALALRPIQVVLDLAGCPFADAAVIGLLLEAHRTARRSGGVLTVRNPSPRLRRNLHLARVDRVLHVTGEPPESRSGATEVAENRLR